MFFENSQFSIVNSQIFIVPLHIENNNICYDIVL